MNTPATPKVASDFKTYAGISGDPTFAEYGGYLAIAALVLGLQAAGSHPTQASFINAKLGINNFDAEGLYGSHPLSFGMAGRGQASGVNNCDYVTPYSGSTFHLVPGIEPICGNTVAGHKVQ
jgi:branched-chain amino acid transport system substrate-binding protein